MPVIKQPEIKQKFHLTVLSFENGIQNAPVKIEFFDVEDWHVTNDNTLIMTGEMGQYICPAGMWQSIRSKKVD
jgi:hypothetical protein